MGMGQFDRYLWMLILVSLGWLGLSNFDATSIDLPRILEPPSLSTNWLSWLGYDELGRSVLLRLLMGVKTALGIASFVVLISLVVGTAIGVISGFIGGWVDSLIVRIIDVFLAFPSLLLAILLAALLGPGLVNLVVALSVVGWVGFARISRSQVLSLRSQDFVIAARAQGLKPKQIMLRYITPLIASVILVEATFAFAAAILAEAGLSFLGLGVQPPQPSWGQMIRAGAEYMLIAPHLVMAPGVALWLSVLGINLLGEKLNQRFVSSSL